MSVDTDKIGSISHDELKVMLNKAGYEATDKVAKVRSGIILAHFCYYLGNIVFKSWRTYLMVVH